jgi:hypothetical protein
VTQSRSRATAANPAGRARRAAWCLLVVAAGWALAGCGPADAGASSAFHSPAGAPAASPTAGSPTAGAPTAGPPTASPSPAQPDIRYPAAGPRTYSIATTGGPVAGTAGTLLSYRIAVENGIQGISANEFAGQVSAVLSDPRSWIGTGRWRLRQVAAGAHYDFTIYLVSPTTRDKLCGDGYDRYTSCRNGNSVVLNVARWVHGVPSYGTNLADYRTYMINHETGHRLYNGHELCPGPGRPAPVMQQQTLGMHGCVPNSWPMVNGHAYHGRSGQYDDPIPSDPPQYTS